MEMDPVSRLAELSVRRRPFGRLIKVALRTLIALDVRKIKVDDNMIDRRLRIVLPRCVLLRENRTNDGFRVRREFLSLSRFLIEARSL